jgi:hypothetical protein
MLCVKSPDKVAVRNYLLPIRNVEEERQSLKAVVAKLSDELKTQMHPDTLKRFLKNLATLSAASANASRKVRSRSSTLKEK